MPGRLVIAANRGLRTSGRMRAPAESQCSLASAGMATPAVYPPHPEEGAQRSAIGAYKHSVAPVSKDGAAPWFETPRTRLRNLARSKIAAPHHEGRERSWMH